MKFEFGNFEIPSNGFKSSLGNMSPIFTKPLTGTTLKVKPENILKPFSISRQSFLNVAQATVKEPSTSCRDGANGAR